MKYMYDLGHLSPTKFSFLIRIEVKNQQVNNSKPEDTESHPAPPPASRHPAGPGLILWTADSRSASAADCLLLRPRKAPEARSLDHSEQRHGHGDTWKLKVHEYILEIEIFYHTSRHTSLFIFILLYVVNRNFMLNKKHKFLKRWRESKSILLLSTLYILW